LLQVAERYGFQAVYLEDLNMHEQIYLMQNADFVLGPSGAAWTNVIFCPPSKTKGLLWLANVWKDFSVFSTLAELSDFDLYHWRFGDDTLGFHDDYVLDPNEFEQQLIQLLR
jgi:capsular polysaccharide biosynthesis protein